MQHKDTKTSILAQTVGTVIKKIRIEQQGRSINKLAREYDLDIGNLSRIEKGRIDVKLVTLWKISEALNIKLSEVIKMVEENFDKDFHLYDD